MERFAVLNECRGKGVGRALVKKVESNIQEDHDLSPGDLFMHAQIDAVDFYKSLGYSTEGDQFVECGIIHLTMRK